MLTKRFSIQSKKACQGNTVIMITSATFDSSYFVFTTAACVISTTNGSLSAASSILIMSIILRSSPEARYSVYHIIMFFMSFWEAVDSIVMALGVIPMPQDVYEIYPFAGEALGNVGTCEAQGTLNIIGSLFVIGSITTLNLYYVCTFRFTMHEEEFKRYVMPVMLVLYMALSIVVTVYILRKDLINPTPFGTHCTFGSYPFGCTEDLDNISEKIIEEQGRELDVTSSVQCIRGGHEGGGVTLNFMFIILGGFYVILAASMILVVVTMLDVELSIRKRRRDLRDTSTEENGIRNPIQEQIEDFKRTRVVMIQALMYIIAFLMTWIFGILMDSSTTPIASRNIVASLKIMFRPLQGFFNAMIFVHQKVYILRRFNRTLTLSGAFKQVILSPQTVPQEIVSRIEIATEDVSDNTSHEGIIDGNTGMRRHSKLYASLEVNSTRE